MPSLNFKGKALVQNFHLLVPFHELKPVKAKSLTDKPSLHDNLVVHGDNLQALKALLPYYHGRVKCIYIDPPYNTGNEGWVYNDNVNSPMMQEWLGKQVDRDDLTRHDKWLCMMLPRLKLLRDFLTDEGAIFVSIDDVEMHRMRSLLDEVFGEENFVANVIWEKGKKGDAKLFAAVHEYVLVYARNKELILSKGIRWRRAKAGVDRVLAKYDELRTKLKGDHALIRDEMMSWYRSLSAADAARAHKHYNWSDDRGLYFPADFAGPDDGRESRPRYDIIHPITKKPCAKPSTGWRWDEERTQQALGESPPRIHFGPDETTIPNRKTYLKEVTEEAAPTVFYKDGRAATLMVEQILGKDAAQVPFPKDVDSLADLLGLVADKDAIVLDAFAGSRPRPTQF
jgi:adenine-specific DNA-methyltransferase